MEEKSTIRKEDSGNESPLDSAATTTGELLDPEEVFENIEYERVYKRSVQSINDFPPYRPEAENPDILVKGRWLERGGSAWWISTAGTGKSIVSVQLAYLWGAGIPFAGLVPQGRIVSWIVQSEDSPSRITIDREDVVAELSEQYSEVEWKAVGEKCVKFVKIRGKVGAAFLEELDTLISLSVKYDVKPDVLIINPFLAFVGGPVTDGGYVTPFLRGGDINHQHTDGLQALLEKHNIATLIFHHTPKPPTEKELDGWLKSMFPEYQGAGSSDITNWGRSFVTMMKVKGHSRMVCLVAGKNGGEIGWKEIGGSRRKYLAWSNGKGITGGCRHAWRDLTEEELESVAGKEITEDSNDTDYTKRKMIDALIETPMKLHDIEANFTKTFGRRRTRAAWKEIKNDPTKYGLSARTYPICGQSITIVGEKDKCERMAEQERKEAYEREAML